MRLFLRMVLSQTGKLKPFTSIKNVNNLHGVRVSRPWITHIMYNIKTIEVPHHVRESGKKLI
jgi:hypothetical protein